MNHLNAETLLIVRTAAEKNCWGCGPDERARRISAAMERLAAVEADSWANDSKDTAHVFGAWLGFVLASAERASESDILPRALLGFYGGREFHAWLSTYCFGFILADAEKDRADRLKEEDKKATEEALKAMEEAEKEHTEEEGE